MMRVCLLGDEAIMDDATGAVRSRSWRTLALVAFLVVHAGTPQSRQRIAGLFWPDSTERQALTNLRRELHHLRDVLGDEPSLEVTPKDLRWRDTATCRVDVRCFAADRAAALAAAPSDDDVDVLRYATSALEHYRGELLPGRYDDWVLDARSELERQCVELCDLQIGKRAGSGDLTGALDVARRRVGLRPLEEVGYRNLMELQAEHGRPGRCGEHVPPLRRDPRARARCRPGPDDAPDGAAVAGPGAPGRRRRPRDDRPADPAARLRRDRPRRSGPRAGAAPRRLANRRRGSAARARARPRRRRQDPPGDRARRRAGPGRRGGCDRPVLRDRRVTGAGTGRGLAAEPGRADGGGAARPGLAGRGRQVGAVGQGAGRAGRRPARPGGCLAATPLLRRAGAGADRCRPADAAGPRQRAVVRRGDARVHHVRARAAHQLVRAAHGRGDPAGRRARPRGRRREVGREDAGQWTPYRGDAAPAGGRRHGPTRRGDLRTDGRRRRDGGVAGHDGRLPAVHRRGRPQRRRSSAAHGCRSGTSRRCCPVGSSRWARRPATWRVSPPRPGATSHSTCSSRRATSGPAWSSRLSTSCGAGASCANAGTATSSRTTCCARPHTRRSARRSGGCCTGVWRRRSSCSTPGTRTRSARSSPSSTYAADGSSGRWRTTDARPTSRLAGSPMPRRSACTPPHSTRCAPCPRGDPGTATSSPCSKPWPHPSTPASATRPRSSSGPWSEHWFSPSRSAVGSRRSPRSSHSGRRARSGDASPTDTRWRPGH